MSTESNENKALQEGANFVKGLVQGIFTVTASTEYKHELDSEISEHPDESGATHMGHAIGRTIKHFFRGNDDQNQ